LCNEIVKIRGGLCRGPTTRECIGKNPSPTSAKDKATEEYISEGQPSPLELAFGFELGLNSHSKNLRGCECNKS